MTPFDWDTPVMRPLLAIAGLVVVVAVTGGLVTSCYRTKAVNAEIQSREAKGQADAYRAQAEAKDKEIQAKDADLDKARATVREKLAELARLRANLSHSGNANAPVVPVEPILPGQEYLELDKCIEISIAQDKVIESQKVLITDLDAKVFNLTVSRDLWKASAGASERESISLRCALEAQKSLTKSAIWKGRFQGVAFGLAAGYVGGRLR